MINVYLASAAIEIMKPVICFDDAKPIKFEILQLDKNSNYFVEYLTSKKWNKFGLMFIEHIV